MMKLPSAKEKKELERRFGEIYKSMGQYNDHIDLRCLDKLDDKAFAFLMENVKAVNMLDLNETDISNESIKLLTGLEYVNELRAKECYNLNDNCVKELNKLNSLVFLHLKDTAITIDGLLKLNNLGNLKTLMFSADDVKAIKQKLLQLKTMLPSCEIVVNSKPYYVNAIDIFIEALKTKPFKYRLKIKNQSFNSEWTNKLFQTDNNNVEEKIQTQFHIDDIEWIEIKPGEKRMEEELVRKAEPDSWFALIKMLEVLEFPYVETDGVISVYILNKEI